MGDAYGVKNGWFCWPINFDPHWLTACDGFKAKETEITLKTPDECKVCDGTGHVIVEPAPNAHLTGYTYVALRFRHCRHCDSWKREPSAAQEAEVKS
jgi:hypothetical protein